VRSTGGYFAATLAKNYVRSLKSIAPPEESFSNNIVIALRGGGAPYVDTYRHVPMGWQVRALVASYPLLESADRDRANERLSAVLKASLNIGRMAWQDWMLAEHVFSLRSALAAFATAAPATQ
jgi:hypothetical protein